jgi:hypothetical protein
MRNEKKILMLDQHSNLFMIIFCPTVTVTHIQILDILLSYKSAQLPVEENFSFLEALILLVNIAV